LPTFQFKMDASIKIWETRIWDVTAVEIVSLASTLLLVTL